MSAPPSLLDQPTSKDCRYSGQKRRLIDLGYSDSAAVSVLWALLPILASFLLACTGPVAQEKEILGWELDDEGMLPEEFFDESNACLKAASEKFDDGVTSAETVGRIVALRCFEYMQTLVEADFQGEELTRDMLEERAFLIGTGAVINMRKNARESNNNPRTETRMN